MNDIKNNFGLTLSAFSILEPDNQFISFYPSWYNVNEANLFKKACKRSGVDNFIFKRFGIDDTVPLVERVRKTSYREWINSLNASCTAVLKDLSSKDAFRLKQEKTALFYIDSWGETSILEGVNSWRDSLSIDILPKAIIKQFQIQNITGKIRGERNALLNAMMVSQDLIQGGSYDNVIICGQYRAHPIHVFSELLKPNNLKVTNTSSQNIQEVTERVGCFLFQKNATNGTQINIESYQRLPSHRKDLIKHFKQSETLNSMGSYDQVMISHPPLKEFKSLINEMKNDYYTKTKKELIVLNQIYAESGCLNPASAFEQMRLNEKTQQSALLYVFDLEGGYWTLSLHSGFGNI